MTKSVSEKSNLYIKYLKELAPGLPYDKTIDIDRLIGVKVKTMWDIEKGKNGEDYQVIKMIKPLVSLRPEELLVPAEAPPMPGSAVSQEPLGDDLPFCSDEQNGASNQGRGGFHLRDGFARQAR
jgi:DNA-binding XRE family transcriptional regulator